MLLLLLLLLHRHCSLGVLSLYRATTTAVFTATAALAIRRVAAGAVSDLQLPLVDNVVSRRSQRLVQRRRLRCRRQHRRVVSLPPFFFFLCIIITIIVVAAKIIIAVFERRRGTIICFTKAGRRFRRRGLRAEEEAVAPPVPG